MAALGLDELRPVPSGESTKRLAVVCAAQDVRDIAWQLVAQAETGPDLQHDDKTRPRDLSQALDQLSTVQLAADERSLVDQLRSKSLRMQQEFYVAAQVAPALGSAPINIDVESLAATANEICQSPLLEPSAQVVGNSWIAAGRSTWWGMLALVGPLLGIGLGWYIRRRPRSLVAADILRFARHANGSRRIAAPSLLRQCDAFATPGEETTPVLVSTREDGQRWDAAGDASQGARQAALAELALQVAHELRNPLTSVKLLMQNAVQRQDDIRLLPDELSVMLSEVSRMERTIRELCKS